MLSRTVVHNRLPTPSCRNLQECKSHGTVVKRGGNDGTLITEKDGNPSKEQTDTSNASRP